MMQEFVGHQPLSETIQKACLEEILKANPKFPTKKIFRMYQAKKSGEPLKKEETNSGKMKVSLEHSFSSKILIKNTKIWKLQCYKNKLMHVVSQLLRKKKK